MALYEAERRFATPRAYRNQTGLIIERIDWRWDGPIIGATVSYSSRGSPMCRSSSSGLATSSAKNSPTVRPVTARTSPLTMKPYVIAW